jgi:predicted metal-dependent phosphotriesterase family hydrolase
VVAATIRAPGERRHAVIIMGAAVGKGNAVAAVETVRGPVDLDYLTELADAGVLLGMDRFGLDLFNPGAERIKTIAALAARGYAGSMVLAHDANCFIDCFGAAHDEARAAAAPNWHYEHITDDVLPALLAAGVTQEQIEEMMVENPVRYFTPAKDSVTNGGAS